MDKPIWKQLLGYAVIAVAAWSAYLAWPGSGNNEAQLIAGQMPPCDSAIVRQLLAQTVEQSPRALQQGLKLIQIGEIDDYLDSSTSPNLPETLDPNKAQRFCQSKVFTNAGKGEIHFNLTWTDTDKARLWLQVTVVTF
jgi:hypothetical protein